MDYRDINNTNFNDTDFGSTNFGYPIPAAYGGLYQYPFLGQPSRVEGMATQAHETLVDPWSTIPWQGPAAGHSTSLLAATRRGKHHRNFSADLGLTRKPSEPVAEIASLTSELDGYGQLSYTNTSTPMVDRPSQSTYPDYLSQDALLAGRVMALETSSTIPGPSSGKDLLCFAGIEYGMLTDHQQSRLTTGRRMRKSPPRAHLTGCVVKLGHHSTVPLTQCMIRTSPVLAPQGLDTFQLNGSNHMRHLVQDRWDTGKRRKLRRPKSLSPSHTLTHQLSNPPGG